MGDPIVVLKSLVVLAILVAAFVVLKAFRRRSRGETFRIGDIHGDGKFSVEVVGESHYLDNLRAIVGTRDAVRHECQALLFLDDRNEHDLKAVAVQIDGKTVGHLPREGARQYRARLQEAGVGRIAGRVGAVIVGGGPGRPNLGVWLDMPTVETPPVTRKRRK